MMRFVQFSISLMLLFLTAALVGHVDAGESEEWDTGAPNECKNNGDYFNDFEVGVDGVEIEASNPGILFSNTDGLDWVYGDVTVGGYNVNDDPVNYTTNGNNFAWLGQDGDVGRIDFLTRTATYVSILTSSAGLNLVAYDSDDEVVDSISTGDSRGLGKMVRLTVEADEIAYVEVFDSGNFWIIDDLCTDFQPPECIAVPGYDLGPFSRRINIVFLKDADYDAAEDFLTDVTSQIEERLLAAPIPGSDPATVFNFLYSPDQEGDSDPGAGGAWEAGVTCGPAILPDNFDDFCAYDVAVVLHTQTFTDCSSGGVIGAEAAVGRTLIHEIGHAAFGLSDEYDDAPDCATGYATNNNVYDNEDNCNNDIEANAPESGFSCFKFTECRGDRWKVNDSVLNIMDDGNNFANGWSPSSAWFITEVVTARASGEQAEAESELDPKASSTRSLNVRLNIGADGSLTLQRVGLRFFPPRNYPRNTDDDSLVVEIFNGLNQRLKEIRVPNPLTGDGEPGSGNGPLESFSDFIINIPYFSTAQSMTIENGQKMLTVNLAPVSGQEEPETDPPVAVCSDVEVSNDPGLCSADVSIDSIDNESFDEAGRNIDLFVSPFGPYPVGTTEVTLDVTNTDEWTAQCFATVKVVDNEDPVLTIPPDETVECDSIPSPPDLVDILTLDNCGVASVDFEESTIPGECAGNFKIERSWTVTDVNQNSVTEIQTITVQDTTAPTFPPCIDMFSDISPNQVNQKNPMVFNVMAMDNCDDDPATLVTESNCYKVNPKGKLIDRNKSCDIDINGDSVSIYTSSGVGTVIEFEIQSEDACGNIATQNCAIDVVNPKQLGSSIRRR